MAAAIAWNVRHRHSRNGDVAYQNAMERYSVAQDEILDRFRNGLEALPAPDPPILCAPPT